MQPNLIHHTRICAETALRAEIPNATDYALLDFPDHGNVGDSAIFLGEIKILENIMGRRPSYISCANKYSKFDLMKNSPFGPIFLHGGGNFGDIWPKHQKFRYEIFENFPDRKIIQMPQSIHFQSEAVMGSAARHISAHPNFTLFARDLPSKHIAEENFDCKVRLCPDSAVFLNLIRSSAQCKLLCLLRKDREKLHGQSECASDERYQDAVIQDWLPLGDPPLSTMRRITKKTRSVLGRRFGPPIGFRHSDQEYYSKSLGRVSRGCEQLNCAEFIITDRLHGHILASLLEIPHVVLDNVYGKIGNYIETWGRPDALVGQAKCATGGLKIYRECHLSRKKDLQTEN